MNVLKLDPTLCEKVIRLSATDSSLTINPSSAGTRNSPEFKIMLAYSGHFGDFIEINTIGKNAKFLDEPRSYTTETGCIDLARYLQSQGYKVGGLLDFLKERRFKPNEFSIV